MACAITKLTFANLAETTSTLFGFSVSTAKGADRWLNLAWRHNLAERASQLSDNTFVIHNTLRGLVLQTPPYTHISP